MRSLLVTPMLPVRSADDLGGMHRRVGASLRAMHRLGGVEIVHIVPPTLMHLADDPKALNESQMEFWQIPVSVTLVPRRARPQTMWNYYGAGIFDAREQPALYSYGGKAIADALAKRLGHGHDLVVADRLDAMVAIEACGVYPTRLVYDTVDIYHQVRLRSALTPPTRPSKIALLLQIPALAMAERRAVARATLTFVCSTADGARLRHLGAAEKIRVIPNAIEFPEVAPDVCAAQTILFLGTYHHPPNVIAAERLIRQIFPLILARVPSARLLIAGVQGERLPSRANPPAGVEYLGFVDDLGSLYAGTRVVCAPITTGSGTRLKLLEAGAYAKPMVSTRVGAEGLDFRDGTEIAIRETDEEIADACVTLLLDDALCRRYGGSARAMVGTRYDVRRIEDRIVEEFGGVV